MKVIAKCLKCKQTVETNDRAMIEQGESLHICKCEMKIVKVKWKVFPEDYKDLKEIEER